MPRRAATVTQADVARTIRAVMAAHLTIVRVVTRPDGVSIETAEIIQPPRKSRRPLLAR
jgi:hypothetical protein